MINREIAKTIKTHLNYFPVVAITGPRQSGKSTIIQATLKDYHYVNLEDINAYHYALEDPVGFIANCPEKTIIDEAQLAPDLFSAIQLRVDKVKKNDQFVLSGSHNFLLQKNIRQSLAGRISLLKLLPLSVSEIINTSSNITLDHAPIDTEKNSKYNNKFIQQDTKIQSATEAINNLILNGLYPRIYDQNIPIDIFYRNYIETYLARDIQGYLDVRNIETFYNFLFLIAQDVGGIVNYSRYANDLKIDVRTIKNWINILVASYVIYLLPAYSTNARKQIIKSPKIYFCDTGILCYLSKIDSPFELVRNAKFGKIYENFIIVENLKKYYNTAKDCRLNYYRDKSKKEIDLIDSSAKIPIVSEIKSTMTYKPEFQKTLLMAEDLLGLKKIDKQIIYRGDRSFSVKGVNIMSEAELFNLEQCPTQSR